MFDRSIIYDYKLVRFIFIYLNEENCMASKNGIIGGIITLVIGGAVFNVSSADIAKNFSKDTGMSQQQAEQYVENVSKDDLVSYDKLGLSFVSEGQDILKQVSKIDCTNNKYEWETESLSCENGKLQLKTLGDSEVTLGNAYTVLASKSATTEDISSVIMDIDKLNTDLNFEIVKNVFDYSTIDETKKTNSYNKAMLQAALDSKK